MPGAGRTIWLADCGVACACEEISMSEIPANDLRWFVLSPNIGCLISRQQNIDFEGGQDGRHEIKRAALPGARNGVGGSTSLHHGASLRSKRRSKGRVGRVS